MFYSHRDSPRVEVPVPNTRANFNYWGAYELLSQLIENRAKPLCKVTPRRASQLQWLPSSAPAFEPFRDFAPNWIKALESAKCKVVAGPVHTEGAKERLALDRAEL